MLLPYCMHPARATSRVKNAHVNEARSTFTAALRKKAVRASPNCARASVAKSARRTLETFAMQTLPGCTELKLSALIAPRAERRRRFNCYESRAHRWARTQSASG